MKGWRNIAHYLTHIFSSNTWTSPYTPGVAGSTGLSCLAVMPEGDMAIYKSSNVKDQGERRSEECLISLFYLVQSGSVASFKR